MLLIAGFDVVQYLDSFIKRSRFNQDFLKTAFQCPVFFYILSVFIQRRGPNTLNLSASQGRFQHIGCIQASAGTSRTDNGMDFIYKQDYILILGQFIEYSFHPLLKLPTVFCSRYNGSDVQCNDPFAKQHPGYLLLHNTYGQPFRNSRFPDPRFTYQYRVILFPPAQDLCQTFYLIFTPHNRIKRTLFRRFGNIDTEIVQHWRISLAHCRLAIGIEHRIFLPHFLLIIGILFIIRLHRCPFFQQLLFEDVIVYPHRFTKLGHKSGFIT